MHTSTVLVNQYKDIILKHEKLATIFFSLHYLFTWSPWM